MERRAKGLWIAIGSAAFPLLVLPILIGVMLARLIASSDIPSPDAWPELLGLPPWLSDIFPWFLFLLGIACFLLGFRAARRHHETLPFFAFLALAVIVNFTAFVLVELPLKYLFGR